MTTDPTVTLAEDEYALLREALANMARFTDDDSDWGRDMLRRAMSDVRVYSVKYAAALLADLAAARALERARVVAWLKGEATRWMSPARSNWNDEETRIYVARQIRDLAKDIAAGEHYRTKGVQNDEDQ